MSRTQEQGINYVPLDVNFFNDPKIQALKVHHGRDGMLIYLYMLTVIYREGYYTVCDEDFKCMVANQLGVALNKVELVLIFCLKRSMFDEQLFRSDKVLTSAGIQERWQMAVRTRGLKLKQTVSKDFWLVNEAGTKPWIVFGERGNYTHSENSSTEESDKSMDLSDKSMEDTQSKVKESNYTITITPVSGAETGTPAKRAEVTQEDVISYCRSNGYKINPIKFFEYYSKKEWKTKDGKPITDWYALADDWEKKERRKAVRDDSLKNKAESFDTEEFFAASVKNTYGDLSDEVIADLGK